SLSTSLLMDIRPAVRAYRILVKYFEEAKHLQIEDKHCQFYLQALTTMKGAPMIGLGEEVCGFPCDVGR
ncbi:hypothetical protein, partial [Paenibacillus aceris]